MPTLIEPNVLGSIGKIKDELANMAFVDALTADLISELRHQVAAALNADLATDTSLTEIIAPIIIAWIREAGDPDVPLGKWLLGGAPAGIDAQPENVGVFPMSEAPPTQEFQLSFWDGGVK